MTPEELMNESPPQNNEPLFTIKVTRKEFLKLPKKIKDRALRDMAIEYALNDEGPENLWGED